ncbi:sigma-70 family RNA polymerase sigma factor (plasmid) [Rhizobium grahamii]|uniref:Sigma-70 family RNA polymerase sigma factor n=1 Tax=Rhizobium grahamii TaxID=1120045 RepID=A0A5Q0C975_9HYPH|nr:MULTISPECIES: sigma-70 family RNA polymerase sigma factor [Rhizobium]QFY62528.1 sigma-70 family RNA polymerase sigma factor [Rhizobium grahamii]QRM52730.1 sigma-70 family RNA polymerase sigma factor [Rhizobium sp. BG6]
MTADIARLDEAFFAVRLALHQRVLRIVRDGAVADELTQETYLRARRAIASTVPNNMEAFLWQTARNLALDHIRWSKVRAGVQPIDALDDRTAAIADPQPSIEEKLVHRDDLRALSEALRKLPARAQRVWILSRVEGWPYPRIAQHLGVSPNTVFNDIKMVIAVLYDLRRKDSL